MAYDKTQDKLVVDLGFQKKLKEQGKPFLRAGIYKYKDGDPKMSIERYFTQPNGTELYRPTGRFSLGDAQFVGRMAKRWQKWLDDGENQ